MIQDLCVKLKYESSTIILFVSIRKSQWTCPVRANTDHHVVPIACGAWSPSRISLGTDPLSAVRRRPAEADQTSPVGPPCLCRRHSNLRFLSAELCQLLSRQSVGLHWWSVVLDEVQPAAGQSVEDRGALVFFQSTSATDPDLACAYRQHLCTTGHFRSWSRALRRLWR